MKQRRSEDISIRKAIVSALTAEGTDALRQRVEKERARIARERAAVDQRLQITKDERRQTRERARAERERRLDQQRRNEAARLRCVEEDRREKEAKRQPKRGRRSGKDKRAQRVARRLARRAARETSNPLPPLNPSLTHAEFYGERRRALRKMGFPSYAVYLASPLWARIRARVFALDEGLCRLCQEPATEIHHTNYDRHTLKGRSLRHLHALCHGCHERVEFDDDPEKRQRRVPYAMQREVEAGIQNDRAALRKRLLEMRRFVSDLDSDFRARLDREP